MIGSRSAELIGAGGLGPSRPDGWRQPRPERRTRRKPLRGGRRPWMGTERLRGDYRCRRIRASQTQASREARPRRSTGALQAVPSEDDNFESFVDRLYGSGVLGDHLCSAILDVADAAHACKLWFESNGLRPTAADVAAMSRLVMEREAAIKASGGGGAGTRPAARKSTATESNVVRMDGHGDRA